MARVKHANTRYASLLQQSRGAHGRKGSVESEALRELSAALEELNVAEEELRVQNQALRDAYYEVEKERRHYEELFTLVPDAYIVTDIYATILDANRAAEEMLRAPVDRLRGKPLAVFVAEEDRREFRAHLNRAAVEGDRFEWTSMVAPRGGTPVRALLRVARIHGAADHQQLGWVIHDATEKQRAVTLGKRFAQEQTARIEAERSARRFRAIAEISRLLAVETEIPVICQSIAKTVVRFVGDHCEIVMPDGDRLMSISSWDREPRQATFAEALKRRHHLDADDPESLVWRALRSNEPQLSPAIPAATDTYSRKDLFAALRESPRNAIALPLSAGNRPLGVMVVLSSSPVPQFGPDDAGVLLEIAARAALAIRNAQLFHELECANREKAEFLAVLSHELRTPLSAAIGYTDLLLTGIPDALPERAREHVERIRSCSWHQLGIVEQIIKYARIESGKDAPVLAEVDLQPLIDEVTEVVKGEAGGSAVQLSIDIPTGTTTIVTDSGRLRQILINLLANAFKFTDEGAVALVVRRTDDDIFFTVADTGIGIAAADLDRVFDPFWRAASQRPRTGMGLGLAVSGQLARSLGGDVTVQSQVGVGTVFTLRLPLH